MYILLFTHSIACNVPKKLNVEYEVHTLSSDEYLYTVGNVLVLFFVTPYKLLYMTAFNGTFTAPVGFFGVHESLASLYTYMEVPLNKYNCSFIIMSLSPDIFAVILT